MSIAESQQQKKVHTLLISVVGVMACVQFWLVCWIPDRATQVRATLFTAALFLNARERKSDQSKREARAVGMVRPGEASQMKDKEIVDSFGEKWTY